MTDDCSSLGYVVARIRKMRPYCLSCGKPLVNESDGDVSVGLYDHEGGVCIRDVQGKQWVSIHCHECGFDNSLDKLLRK